MIVLLLGLGILLATARLLGEVAQRCNQPAVLGEMLAGIIFGPTLLGRLAPQLTHFLFPSSGPAALAFDGFTALAITLFLLIAGIEVDLSVMWRQGKAAGVIGLAGTVFPFAMGYVAAVAMPGILGHSGQSDPRLFALFLATALSITALPVIAKVLMDLGLYRGDLGMMIVGAAVFNDLIGAIIFAVLLSMMGGGATHDMSIAATIGLTLGFAVLMLTIGRALIHRSLPWLQAHTSWPGGVLAFALSIAMLSAAFTEWVGVHAIFGAFLAGVAIGDSSHLREHTRSILGDFVSFIFAPVFFASVGLRVNFVAQFDLVLVLVVLVIACAGKILSCGLSARWLRLPWREAWAIGFGMNARGAMEIIFGLLALQYKLIDERMFVALVIMALVTSMMSGPAMYAILKLQKSRRLMNFLNSRAFVNSLVASTRDHAIHELVQAACTDTRFDANTVAQAVLARESLMSTGMGNGLAIPHARIEGLGSPIVALGVSRAGIDFNAPDGEPAHLVFLILTPQDDDKAQIEILADLAKTFREAPVRQAAMAVANYTQLLALLRTRHP
jgi:Kef-type K+ transport system membrane component KefB/mannitol/fructose-specific phosphotransferase system IIA component (Ntr-type)